MLARCVIRLVVLVICTAFTLTNVLAAPLKIHTAKLAPSATQIWVQFETPAALTDCDVEFWSNRSKAWLDKCASRLSAVPWVVVAYSKTGEPTPLHVNVSQPIGNLAADGLVRLDLVAAISAGYFRIDVTFTKGNLPHFSIEGSNPPTTKWVAPAKTKDDSNVYISGTFAPAEGSSPTYTIDSKASYILQSFKNGHYTLSASGDVNTDKKKTADPDSFHWAIPVQYVGKSPFTLQLPTIGMELDKKGNAINLVSTPGITRGFGHTFVRPDPKFPEAKTVSASIGLDLSGGLEFGSNLKNDFAVANKTIGGQGWFLRGVPSASVYVIIPNILRLNKISITSSYTARIPTTNEVFIETRHVAKPTPELSSNTRNFVQNAINFMLTDYLGIQIKHQYGSLPPAFNLAQNSGSIGLVLALKETRAKK